MRIPFIKPSPPTLDRLSDRFNSIDKSGIYSNFGPQNSLLEDSLRDIIFSKQGHCLTVCNATLGLMIAIRDAVDARKNKNARYALVPSFTFAATAHAVLWCGLTPILYDIEPETWLPSRAEEDRLLEKFGDSIGVIVPYATFGNCLDLDRYESLARTGPPVVIDAAASLGSIDRHGQGFGTGSTLPIVFSMHATKTFSASEGGVIYCDDADRISRLRAMSNFGFSKPRVAELPGLNAKLSEYAAAIANETLCHFGRVTERRSEIYSWYTDALKDLEFQRHTGLSTISQFLPVLLPDKYASVRDTVVHGMGERNVGVAKYFSPHLAEQPYFKRSSLIEPLPVTEDVSSRIISLPMYDTMRPEEVSHVTHVLNLVLTDRRLETS